MNLQYIKTIACPYCRTTRVRSEEIETWDGQYRKHTSGGHWESRTFACGYETAYIPNYGREEGGGECARCPEYRAKVKKRETAKQATIAFIDGLDVDEDFKSTLKRYL